MSAWLGEAVGSAGCCVDVVGASERGGHRDGAGSAALNPHLGAAAQGDLVLLSFSDPSV